MITLFHFSDLHLSPKSNIYKKFGIDVSTKIKNEIDRNHFKIDYIIFTGDFAYKEKGFKDGIEFFNELAEKLDLDKSKFLFVPGNHEITADSDEKGFNFSKYYKFINEFYRDKINYIYGDNFYDKFHKDDFSFNYLLNDNHILISGFHRENHKSMIINYELIENTDINYRDRKLIKIGVLHEAIQPIIGIDVVDMAKNAGYFAKKLSNNGYRIFLTGHSHKSDMILLNNDYLNVTVGPFGLPNYEKSYNIIQIDGNIIIVKSYSADTNLIDPFVLKNQRFFEVKKSGIFELTNLNQYKINSQELFKISSEKKLKGIILDFLVDNGVDVKTLTELDDSPYIYLTYDVLRGLADILDKQVDNLKVELQDVDEPVEIGNIYRGKEDGNEIRMECIRRNIIEDEIIKKYVKIYIDDVKFIQKDNQTGRPNYKQGKYICIEPATKKHGSVVLPIDKKGNVLLVNQFRHPQRKFITEAIRGFSDFEDDNELITALREFSEEGGGPSLKDLENIGLEDLLIELTKKNEDIHIENEDCAIKDIYYLRSLYTDTGKLWEAPHYYLFQVDHKLQNNNIIRNEPIMESPIWVKFKYVLRSIVQNKAIQLNNHEIEDVFKQNGKGKIKRNHLLKYRDPHIEENKIFIEDAFTSQIVFLSLPILKEFISPKIVEDIFQELKYI